MTPTFLSFRHPLVFIIVFIFNSLKDKNDFLVINQAGSLVFIPEGSASVYHLTESMRTQAQGTC